VRRGSGKLMGAGVATSPHLSQTGAPPGRGPPPWAAGSVPRRASSLPRGSRPGREGLGGSRVSDSGRGKPRPVSTVDPRPRPEGRPLGRRRSELRRFPAELPSRRFPPAFRLLQCVRSGSSALPGGFPKSRPASACAYAGVASPPPCLRFPGIAPLRERRGSAPTCRWRIGRSVSGPAFPPATAGSCHERRFAPNGIRLWIMRISCISSRPEAPGGTFGLKLPRRE